MNGSRKLSQKSVAVKLTLQLYAGETNI